MVDQAKAMGQSAALDLTNCDREPIHILGAIQPFGFLMAVSADWIIVFASRNVPRWLDKSHDEILGAALSDVFCAEAVHTIRGRLQVLQGPDASERVLGLQLLESGGAFDVALHFSGDKIVIEAEPSPGSPENLNASNLVRNMVGRLQQSNGFESFYRAAARQIRALTGFDRVMVYRFDHDGCGEVIAESCSANLPTYLGLRYPASDIPQQARALYQRNWLRLIADVRAQPVPVEPGLSPEGEPLDLSLSVLRSVSPVHLEYLRNMGVAASLSVSIIVAGKLWGLFACHHMEPKQISLERRTAAELFGQMFSWMTESREREEELTYEKTASDLNTKLMSSLASGDGGLDSISELLEEVAAIIPCDGVGVWINGAAKLDGLTLTREEFKDLARFLNRTAPGRPYYTHDLGKVFTPGKNFTDRVSGILSIPISHVPRDYLVFFRREVIRTVTWAGNPEKPVVMATDGLRLNPRTSFEAWREIVHGQSVPWSQADIRIAESLRITFLEVILRLTSAADKERRRSREQQDLLIAELNHRVRNILGLIRGVVSQSRASATSLEDFALLIDGRIQALARAHDQVTTEHWEPGSLRKLIELEASAYLNQQAGRVQLDGEDVRLEPKAFVTIALVIHELMTNAAKYGALSDRGGVVNVAWSLNAERDLVVTWLESQGPPVEAPRRRGFGTSIIERSVPFELKGEAEIAYRPDGVAARFLIPSIFVHVAGARALGKEIAKTVQPPNSDSKFGGAALVVEDNLIIALEAEEMLLALGADRVDLASSVRDAMRSIEGGRPDFALLDMNLGDETSIPIAEHLAALKIPFAFATGYGDDIEVPPLLSRAPVIKKPYHVGELRAALGIVSVD